MRAGFTMTEQAGADMSGVPSFTLHGGHLDVQAAKTIGSHLQVLAVSAAAARLSRLHCCLVFGGAALLKLCWF